MHQPTPPAVAGTLTWRTAVLLGATLLSACADKDWVGMARQSSFSPAPQNNLEPLLKGSQPIADAPARGGYIIYMRHGRTQYDQLKLERSNRNTGKFDLVSREARCQLPDEGRNELRQSGQQFRLA